MMKKTSLKLVVISVAILGLVPASRVFALDQDFTGWYSVTAGGNLENLSPDLRRIRWFILDQTRLRDNSSRFSEHLLFVQAGYEVTDTISLWAGYTHNWANPAGSPAFEENRPYQDFLWWQGLEKHSHVFARTRLEQRISDPGGDLGWRFRQMAEYALPLDKQSGIKLLLSDEAFFYAGSSSWGDGGFSENRAILSVSLPVSTKLDFIVGNMNQYVVNRASPNDMNHVLMVTFGIHP